MNVRYLVPLTLTLTVAFGGQPVLGQGGRGGGSHGGGSRGGGSHGGASHSATSRGGGSHTGGSQGGHGGSAVSRHPSAQPRSEGARYGAHPGYSRRTGTGYGYYRGGYSHGGYYRPYYSYYPYYRPYVSLAFGWPYYWGGYYGSGYYGGAYYGDSEGAYAPEESSDDDDRDPPTERESGSSYEGATGRVRLEVRPDDTSVYLDNQFRGSSREARIMNLPPGGHSIELVRPGFATERREIDVVSRQSQDVFVELRRP